MKPANHFAIKITVIFGFVMVFGMGLLCFWLLSDANISFTQFLQQSSAIDSQIYWQSSRVLAILAYVALWLSVMTGLSISSQSSNFWFERGTALSWHQFFTWLGLTSAFMHAGILLQDSYLQPNVSEVLVPFTMQHTQLSNFAWAWIGLGQLAFYAMLVIAVGSLMQQKLAKTIWRYLHSLALLAYVAIVAHGIFIGTDSKLFWLQWVYLLTNIALLVMVIFRLLQLKLPVTKAIRNA